MIRFPLIDRLPISSTGANPASPRRPGAFRRQIGLWGGMILFVAMVLMEPPSGMSSIAWHTASLAALMAVWWLSEAIPIAATALVPIALAPLFGLASITQVTPHYANPLLFMFLGGFLIAIAMERWNLHRRIALMILKTVGFRPRALVGGFITATAFLSMWVSNTATVTMMLPIALSIVNLLRDNETEPSRGIEDDDESVTEKLAPLTRNFALALLFGIAFGASIGGIGTLIGTPPNALLAGYLASNFDVSIGFGQWMMLGVPFAAVLLLFCWWILTSVVYPQADDLPENARRALAHDIAALGPMSRGEKSVAIVFVTTACLWLFRPLIEVALPDVPISDASIAMFAAIALFAIPVKARENLYLLDWKATLRLPWGVLLLVGGGLALGALINDSGLAAWIAGNAGALPDLPVLYQTCRCFTRPAGVRADRSDCLDGDPDQPSDIQYGDGCNLFATGGNLCVGRGHRPAIACRAGGDCRKLCLHVAGGNAPECYCFCQRLSENWRYGSRRCGCEPCRACSAGGVFHDSGAHSV